MKAVVDPNEEYGAHHNEAAGVVVLNVILPVAGLVALVTADYRKTPFDAEIDSVAAREEIGGDLLRAIARQESRFNPAAISPPNSNGTRDYGLMQINQETARSFGASPASLVTSRENPDPIVIRRSLTIAAQLLRAVRRELKEQSNLYTMVAAYNAGSPAIRRRGIFNVPYVQSVLFYHQLYMLGSLLRPQAGQPPR